ncbi:hypothetical protein MAR_001908 [Mya arenaria]|uniref:TNFR-Cys domain-containing protein n=1 Tax=Mya arenaria TaxID=6604 RepID=A0ABY7FDB4_MYAAR|nr:hypothetical protein MAR_001908 [Mya arenaria]
MKMLGRFIVTINCLVMLSFQVSMVDLVEPIPYLIKIVKPLSTCGPGKYLNANINSSGRCKKCRPCAKGYVEVSPCNNQIDSAQSEVIWTETEVEDNVEFNTHTRLVLVATCTAISFTFLIVLLAWTLQTYRHFANRYQTTLCKICVL